VAVAGPASRPRLIWGRTGSTKLERRGRGLQRPGTDIYLTRQPKKSQVMLGSDPEERGEEKKTSDDGWRP
jgi:hypothetical protein